jgi:hypothetical protein
VLHVYIGVRKEERKRSFLKEASRANRTSQQIFMGPRPRPPPSKAEGLVGLVSWTTEKHRRQLPNF